MTFVAHSLKLTMPASSPGVVFRGSTRVPSFSLSPMSTAQHRKVMSAGAKASAQTAGGASHGDQSRDREQLPPAAMQICTAPTTFGFVAPCVTGMLWVILA